MGIGYAHFSLLSYLVHSARVDSHQRVVFTHLPEGLKLFKVDAVVAVGVNGPEDARSLTHPPT